MKQTSTGFCDPLKKGFDTHMYKGMHHCNELTRANVVYVMLKNIQHRPSSVTFF